MTTHRQDARRAALARSIYRTIIEGTESLESDDQFGPDLAYLMGAILCGSHCAWPADRPIIQLLRQRYPPTHRIWTHLTVHPPRTHQ